MPPVNDRVRLSGRSAVSNGTRLFLEKAGIDYRTLTVRRFKDLIRAFSEEYEVTTEADQSLVRMAAGLTMKAEEMQAALVRGEHVDSDEIIRLTGTALRALRDLKRRAQDGAPPAPSFQQQWADNHEEHEHEGEA